MRRLINYIRSLFCEHDWELIFDTLIQDNLYRCYASEKVYRCKKCGLEHRYKVGKN